MMLDHSVYLPAGTLTSLTRKRLRSLRRTGDLRVFFLEDQKLRFTLLLHSLSFIGSRIQEM